jgi:hypothetical protein
MDVNLNHLGISMYSILAYFDVSYNQNFIKVNALFLVKSNSKNTNAPWPFKPLNFVFIILKLIEVFGFHHLV